ncbi:MAG: hypothetical protein HY287_14930 [Planctomycetes bacterium]|nr:hypothetical protein [Planctomycetota bacterium]MBI3835618.1 hypothetical protein [Planctomycetota bacterium]
MIHVNRIADSFLILLATTFAQASAQICENEWSQAFPTPGMGGALAWFDDGTGPALYVGGGFYHTPDYANVQFIARWNGLNWRPVSPGDYGNVYAPVNSLVVFDDGSGPALYTSISGASLEKWNGHAWSLVDAIGATATAARMVVFDDGNGQAIFVGSLHFHLTSGDVDAYGGAKWDGTNWHSMNLPQNSAIYSFFARNDAVEHALYANIRYGTSSVINVAKWSATGWVQVGQSPEVYNWSQVFVNPTIVTFDDGTGPGLYILGNMIWNSADGTKVSTFARWDGQRWNPMPNPLTPNSVFLGAAAFDDGTGSRIFAGIGFDIWVWDGLNWTKVISLDHLVTGIVSFNAPDPTLFVNGGTKILPNSHDRPYPATVNGLAILKPNDIWRGLGNGADGAVRALGVYDLGGGPSLYAGGDFMSVGGVGAGGIARWDGQRWWPIGAAQPWNIGHVHALTAFDDGSGPALYASGIFDNGYRVARFSNNTWSLIESGDIYSLAVFDDGKGAALYAGGTFQQFCISGGTCEHVARWNGQEWLRLGPGFDRKVNTLVVFDDGAGSKLYAGGDFSESGGIPMSRVSKWDGKAWQAVGEFLFNYPVLALGVFNDGTGSALYAGSGSLIHWDGVSWQAVPNGPGGAILSIVGDESSNSPSLYVAGSLGLPGLGDGTVAQWDGNTWEFVERDFPAYAMALFDDQGGRGLYVGTQSSTNNYQSMSGIGRWGCTTLLGDVNYDFRVDLSDFAIFQECFNNQQAWGEPNRCNWSDLDASGYHDIADFAAFQNAFTGE